MNDFYISIASLPDRKQLVAEICYQGFQWVEIAQETNTLTIQFYTHPQKDYWEFPLDNALNILEQAKKRLLDLGPIRDDYGRPDLEWGEE
jgi:hypothetical protein